MEEYAIHIKNLVKKYGRNVALNGMNVNLHKDQLIGLIGANGSGKTTLLKICAGLENATSGEVAMFGMNPSRDIRICEEIIYSMHDLPVGKNSKVTDIVKYYHIAYPHFDREFCEKLLELFQIPVKKKNVALSQGMKSLVHFSCALATRSSMTLLDEPFIGIDIKRRKTAQEVLLRDYMEYPRTILLSSHNLSELEGLLSEMLLIHEGNIIFYEDMDSVREMLFRIDGPKEEISKVIEGEEYVCMGEKELNGFVVLRGNVFSQTADKARKAGLTVSPVSPEEVSVYLTQKRRERDLEWLWKK